jgi:hypothetical protein
VALALLAIGLPGCVTGHLLDAARRREHPIAITAAGLEGDRLLVRYTAEVTDDTGDGVGTTEAAAALPLSQLRTAASPAADALAPDWIAPARVARGEPIVVARGTASGGDACAGPTLEVIERDGRDMALVWRDAGDRRAHPAAHRPVGVAAHAPGGRGRRGGGADPPVLRPRGDGNR